MRSLIRTCLFAALVAAPSRAQEAELRIVQRIVSVDDLVLRYYRPMHLEVTDLAPAARELFGRQFWLKENGGETGTPTTNMRLLGDRILVYDLPANVERILAGLKEMDASSSAPVAPSEVVQEQEYRPRFVHLETIDELLRPYESEVVLLDQPTRNYVLIEERGVVLLRDTPERLASMRAAIASVDVPPPQVRLRFQILRQVPESVTVETLPDDLAQALAKLLPHSRFQRVGMAVIDSAVLPDTKLRARISVDHEVEIRVRAWDSETKTLTTSSCELFAIVDTDLKQMFQTSAVLRGGERTILAASGNSTDFLVIDLEPRTE